MILSIDIGASMTKYGFVNKNGKLFSSGNFKTPSTYNLFLEEIAAIIKDNNKIEGIGVSTAGIVHENGLIGGNTAISYILKKNMKEILATTFKTKVSVENDANCTSLSYLWGRKKVNSLISVAIGTGTGGSMIFNNQLYTGKDGFAGEFGLAFWKSPNNITSLHNYISTSQILLKINKHFDKPLDGKKAFELYRNNNSIVKKYFDEWFQNIAQFLINIEFSLNPEIILLTGGITSDKIFLKEILNARKELIKTENLFDLKTKIICSKYENNANILGAAYNWYNKYSNF